MKIFSFVLFVFLFASSAAAADKNLIEMHKTADKISSAECRACHANIEKDVSLDKKIKTFHRVHLESKLAAPRNCAACHHSVDLREGSSAALRKQVDPQLCARCHSGRIKGAKVLFAQ